MPEVIDAAVAQPKLRASLLGGFGVVALLLAALGVFGLMSYSVASRTSEFGVRASLGASPSSIGRMIVIQGLSLGAIGLAAGLAAAFGFTRFLKAVLYGVSAYDPTTFFGSAIVLLAVALVACYIPARRAMCVDPVIALRYE
jgi:ABC-type antimicrobial peptide transport system permease subunit